MTAPDDSLWSRSFELVYYNPSPKFRGRTPFRDPENDPLTTEQRIAYLDAYADLLRRENDLGDDWLSSEVVSEEEGRQLASQIKARPLPRNREIVPLRFWRWKLEGAEKDEWVASDFDDSLWNELEVPTVLDMGRAMLLRCTAHIRASERVVLDIESIHDGYDLWVNGEAVAHHEGYEPHQRRHHVVRNPARTGEYFCNLCRQEARLSDRYRRLHPGGRHPLDLHRRMYLSSPVAG